jgi:hypothetical protein
MEKCDRNSGKLVGRVDKIAYHRGREIFTEIKQTVRIRVKKEVRLSVKLCIGFLFYDSEITVT